jgi:hypothetical protein
LSTLDDYFVQRWQQTMGDHNRRYRRRRKGLANWRLIRYADDCAPRTRLEVAM